MSKKEFKKRLKKAKSQKNKSGIELLREAIDLLGAYIELQEGLHLKEEKRERKEKQVVINISV